MEWHRIANNEQELGLSTGKLMEVQAGNRTVCITQYQEQWLACSPVCPHAGAKLAGGFVDALGNVVCPLHHYKFQLKTGRNVSGEGYFLKRFPMEVREDGIYVALEAAD